MGETTTYEKPDNRTQEEKDRETFKLTLKGVIKNLHDYYDRDYDINISEGYYLSVIPQALRKYNENITQYVYDKLKSDMLLAQGIEDALTNMMDQYGELSEDEDKLKIELHVLKHRLLAIHNTFVENYHI